MEGEFDKDGNPIVKEETPKLMGGKKKRKEPSVLASWRKFVRKVQHEEKITYPEAMKRASKRKSEWQRGGSPEEGEGEEMEGGSPSKHFMKGGNVQDFDGNYNQETKFGGRSRKSRRSRRGGSTTYYAPEPEPQKMNGGSRRRRGTKKRRGSRRR
jgi:hypothetical protein